MDENILKHKILQRLILAEKSRSKLDNSVSISLSSMNLTSIPIEIRKIENIKNLNLSKNSIKIVPKWISEQHNLENLNLSQNDIRTIPKAIYEIHSIKKLFLAHNNLTNLSSEMAQLPKLEWIDLSGNKFDQIPEWIKTIETLRRFSLINNFKGELPEWMKEMTSLEGLYISFNHLKTLPEWFRMLKNIRDLNVSGNPFSKFPDVIRHMKNIESINISNTGVNILPNWIHELEKLQGLDLSGNKIDITKSTIGKTSSIRRLHLKNTNLTQAPDCLKNLTLIEGLDLSQNKIETLPSWLANFSRLTSRRKVGVPLHGLVLNGNPLSSPYPEFMSYPQPKATKSIISWLKEATPGENLLDSANIDSRELNRITEQRPAAYRFGIQGQKIDALPDQPNPIDRETAIDLIEELKEKSTRLSRKLLTANCDERVVRSVNRLIDALEVSPDMIRPGVLLSRSRSIEADRDAFDSIEGRKELFPDAVAMMNDVLLSLQDVLALYPIVRKIEVERLALDIQREPENLDIIAKSADRISSSVVESKLSTDPALEALTINDKAIADATTIDVKAGLVSDKLLVTGNFVRAALRAAAEKSKPGAKYIGQRAISGAGITASAIPSALFAVLIMAMLDDIGSIAAFVVMFKAFVGAGKLITKDLSSRSIATKAGKNGYKYRKKLKK